jgi:hypothetical protein
VGDLTACSVAREVGAQPGLGHVSVTDDRGLLRTLVERIGVGRSRAPRWSHLGAVLPHGSGVCAAICCALGLDPDEEVGETAEETLERLGVDPSEVTDGGLDALCLGCGHRDARCDEDGLCVSCGGTIVLVHPASTEEVDEIRTEAGAYQEIRDALRMGPVDPEKVVAAVKAVSGFAQACSGEVPRG